MKEQSRLFRLLAVAALMMTVLIATISDGAHAQDRREGAPNPDPDPPGQTAELSDPEPDLTRFSIYFPWLGHDDPSTGLGQANTSISVQNLDPIDTYIYVYRGDGDNIWTLAETAWLASGASKTFTASELEIPAGGGAPVAVTSYAYEILERICVDVSERENAPETEFLPGENVNGDTDASGDPECETIEQQVTLFDGAPTIILDAAIVEQLEIQFGIDTLAEYGVGAGYAVSVLLREVTVCVAQRPGGGESYTPAAYWDRKFGRYQDWRQVDDLELLWWLDFLLFNGNSLDPNDPSAGYVPSPLRFAGLNNDGDCLDREGGDRQESDDVRAYIGGYAKQAVAGAELPFTTSADLSVSGYNAINGDELGYFDEWYQAIVQTNCGSGGCWNTLLRIANFEDENVAVTARFFPADDGSGSLQTGFQLETLLDGGQTWNIDLSDYVPEGWVGSVHVYSDGAVFSMVDRVKVGNRMWITNTGASADFENEHNVPGAAGSYALFAPDVRIDFYGWNTGINVANLAADDNNINIHYFNLLGNSSGNLTQRLAPHGMTYFYDPDVYGQDNSAQDPATDSNADVIGSAIIYSDYPVAAVVDATKYPEISPGGPDPNHGQAMSYSATANVYNWLGFSLIQKGNPASGMGATSGINLLNPNSDATQITVWWINPSGFGADNYGLSSLSIPAFANGFFYTFNQHNLPNGFVGSAYVYATQPVAAATAQADYQVAGDGTASWLGYNPCGFYRSNGKPVYNDDGVLVDVIDSDCYWGDPFLQPVGGSVKALITDEFGAPVSGVTVELVNGDQPGPGLEGDDGATDGVTENPVDQNNALGYTDSNGEVLWTNVREGNWLAYVRDVPRNSHGEPEFYFDALEVVASFTLNTGEDVEISRQLEHIAATKTVYVGLKDIQACLYGPWPGDDAGWRHDDQVAESLDPPAWFDADLLQCQSTNADGEDGTEDDGMVHFSGLAAGNYDILVNYWSHQLWAHDLFATNTLFDAVHETESFEWGHDYHNYNVMTEAEWGRLRKVITFNGIDLFLVTNVETRVFFCAGGILDETDCNESEDGAVVAHGGFDDVTLPQTQDTWSFEALVPPGHYTICLRAEVTGDWDFDDDTPVETISMPFRCELYIEEESAIRPVFVQPGAELEIQNEFLDEVTGWLDVRVDAAASATVDLYRSDPAGAEPVQSLFTSGGYAHFAVEKGVYWLNASASNCEDETATIDYDIAIDLTDGHLRDDSASDSWDVWQVLSCP